MMSDNLISNLGDTPDDVDVAALDAAIDRATAGGDDQTARLLRKAREENARRRVATRDAAERIRQLEADYEALTGKTSASTERLSALEKELETERQRQQQIVERLEAANKTAIDNLPERFRALAPVGLDAVGVREWLDRAVPLLTNMPVAPLEGQAGVTPDRENGSVAVDEATLTLAKALGIDPQELAKRSKK
jgi:hypothetical protein